MFIAGRGLQPRPKLMLSGTDRTLRTHCRTGFLIAGRDFSLPDGVSHCRTGFLIAGRGLQPRPKLMLPGTDRTLRTHCRTGFATPSGRELQMNADGGFISVHPCSSAVCESCFPGKKSRKTFGQVLNKKGETRFGPHLNII